jgi:hypothetical protein
LRPYFDRQPCKNISLFIIIYKNFVSIKKQMNVEIMQWNLRLSDVVKFKSIISLAQLHGQLNPPPALPFTCVVLFGPTDIRSLCYIENSLIMNHIIKLFLVTFSFRYIGNISSLTSGVKLRSKFTKYNPTFL